jgi:hypothetical protein
MGYGMQDACEKIDREAEKPATTVVRFPSSHEIQIRHDFKSNITDNNGRKIKFNVRRINSSVFSRFIKAFAREVTMLLDCLRRYYYMKDILLSLHRNTAQVSIANTTTSTF